VHFVRGLGKVRRLRGGQRLPEGLRGDADDRLFLVLPGRYPELLRIQHE
jgi:hypothetical protein